MGKRSSSARLLTVNVVHAVVAGPFGDTAIDKRPVDGAVGVGWLGLEGDRQCNHRAHGGPDKAVYAYACEDAAFWADQLGREVPPGQFGENLTTSGLDVSGAEIGERWRIGNADDGVLFEVRMPRTPCENLSARMGVDRFHRDFNTSGRVGALLSVVVPGHVTAGDGIRVERRPGHGVTIAALARGPDVGQMQALLDSGVELPTSVRAKARRIVKRAAVLPT